MIFPVRTDGISVITEENTIHKSVSTNCFQYGLR